MPSLNRFFVSDYFRTEQIANLRAAIAESQSLLRQRLLPDFAGELLSRDGDSVSIASSSAITSGLETAKLWQLSHPPSLNRFFVSDYFRTSGFGATVT